MLALERRVFTRRSGFAVLMVSLGLIASTTPSSDAATSASLLPRSGAFLGAYVQADGWSKAEQKAAVGALERDLGRRLDIDHYYYRWDDVFPDWRQRWDKRNGRIPLISWNATDLDRILDGSHDGMIQRRANDLRELGVPVFLRWFYEMDDAAAQLESPSQYVDAWQHMHDIFAAAGATNVQWVWCPNAWAFSTGSAQDFYPGDAYVDWLCADGYNWAPLRPGSDWSSFQDIFAAFYDWAAPKAQPLMIGETGALENQPGDKARWIRRMARSIRRTYPEIRALVYFDAAATASFGGWYDWRIDTSATSSSAFTRLAGTSYFGGRSPSPGSHAGH